MHVKRDNQTSSLYSEAVASTLAGTVFLAGVVGHGLFPFLLAEGGCMEVELKAGPGMADLTVRSPEIAALADTVAELFDSVGGENYMEIHLCSERYGPMIVLVQRGEGETPAGQNTRLRAEIDSLREEVRLAKANRDGQARPGYTNKSPAVIRILDGLDDIVGRYWEPALVRQEPFSYVSAVADMIVEALNSAE